MNIYRRNIAIVSVAALATVALAYQATVTSLYQDDKLISSNVKTIDGQLYVPVRDLTTYLSGTLSVSDARADISTTGQPQLFAPNTAPVPAPNATPAQMTPAPPPSPTQLTAALNGDISVGDFVYRVTGVKTQNSYRDQFDQRNETFHPQWKGDQIVVVYVSVTNKGSQAETPPLLQGSDLTVFDDQQLGYPATAVDIRQAPMIEGSDMDDNAYFGSPVAMIGPGGSLSYAVIGSIPKASRVTTVRFHMSAPTTATVGPNAISSTGADVTVNVG